MTHQCMPHPPPPPLRPLWPGHATPFFHRAEKVGRDITRRVGVGVYGLGMPERAAVSPRFGFFPLFLTQIGDVTRFSRGVGVVVLLLFWGGVGLQTNSAIVRVRQFRRHLRPFLAISQPNSTLPTTRRVLCPACM